METGSQRDDFRDRFFFAGRRRSPPRAPTAPTESARRGFFLPEPFRIGKLCCSAIPRDRLLPFLARSDLWSQTCASSSIACCSRGSALCTAEERHSAARLRKCSTFMALTRHKRYCITTRGRSNVVPADHWINGLTPGPRWGPRARVLIPKLWRLPPPCPGGYPFAVARDGRRRAWKETPWPMMSSP